MRLSILRSGAACALFGLVLSANAASGVHLSGAIFTTTVNGTVVNENVGYAVKPDVYLDGGPGPNAPVGAAALPEGDYFFQVTDPSGKVLLSTDHISCRKVRVNANGVISLVYAGTNYVRKSGAWAPVDFKHAQGVDADHASDGAITVQLFPFDDTPNPGGVYKTWLTRVEDYAGKWGTGYVPSSSIPVNGAFYAPDNYHGFVPARCKTDNFKVKSKRLTCDTPPTLTIRKFHDKDHDGVQDAGDADVSGWPVTVVDPIGTTRVVYTPATLVVEPAGTWTFTEALPPGVHQTVAMVDGAVVSIDPCASPAVTVSVCGACGETHSVVFGNTGHSCIRACKVYDRNGNGLAEPGEPGVAGWKMSLSGTTTGGDPVGPVVLLTGADGCATFTGLWAGTYTVTEVFPANCGWIATGPVCQTVTVDSTCGFGTIAGTAPTLTFTNRCEGFAGFGTKGYWHNKNGLTELTSADIKAVNLLLPYSTPSSYFDAGDEPFDGKFSNGSPVAAAKGDFGDTVAPAGSAKAEVSSFLVDTNANGDPREQLAQQLLAFLFNAMRRLGSANATFWWDGGWVSSGDLVAQAIAAWASGDASAQHDLEQTLDAMNNSSSIRYIPWNPCSFSYK